MPRQPNLLCRQYSNFFPEKQITSREIERWRLGDGGLCAGGLCAGGLCAGGYLNEDVRFTYLLSAEMENLGFGLYINIQYFICQLADSQGGRPASE